MRKECINICNCSGYKSRCRVHNNEVQRLRRRIQNNDVTKKYERTKKGKLVRTYRNMLSRVKGILVKKSHLYKGKDIMDKDHFYSWALNDDNFNKIYERWKERNYELKVSPTIDRIDPDLGYTLDNVRWTTFSENSRNVRRINNKNNK